MAGRPPNRRGLALPFRAGHGRGRRGSFHEGAEGCERRGPRRDLQGRRHQGSQRRPPPRGQRRLLQGQRGHLHGRQSVQRRWRVRDGGHDMRQVQLPEQPGHERWRRVRQCRRQSHLQLLQLQGQRGARGRGRRSDGQRPGDGHVHLVRLRGEHRHGPGRGHLQQRRCYDAHSSLIQGVRRGWLWIVRGDPGTSSSARLLPGSLSLALALATAATFVSAIF
mmetsp:Transcript_8057/g.15634  ORF Transcript_8057/g.15634 Transcript_8057/m.15634 type:complete len:221 (-) Transcript_8057:266-928(-)